MFRPQYCSTSLTFKVGINCGPGRWYRVAGLNMSDPSEQCPSAWREYNASGVRACRRPTTSSGGYPATFDSMLLVVNTAECVGELLVIKSEIQMPFLVFKQFHKLIPTMSMESVSLMEHLITTSEHMLLVYQKDSIDSNETTVLAATLVILTMHTHDILLEITTTVNQAIQRPHLS